MHAGRTDGTPSTCFVGPVPATDGAVGVTGNGHAFTTPQANHLDRCGGMANSRARDARGHWRSPDHMFRNAARLREQQAAQSARRASSTSEPWPSTGSDSDSVGAGAVRHIPAPLRFLPTMHERTLPPLVIPANQLSGGAVCLAPMHDSRTHAGALANTNPHTGPRGSSWTRRLFSAVTYRLRYWTAPGEHRKALRMTHTREKVVGEAYVFLNALLSDEALPRHFAELQRQVRRLDKRAGILSGMSEESARVLQEAADRIAGARDKARDKILAFHREELLYAKIETDEFHHADGILLVLESRMATGIALYGHALRCIAAIDVDEDLVCDRIGEVLETVFAREASAITGTAQPRDWLGCAVGRLPYRTLVRLYAVLSTGLACGGSYQDFLDELARIVEKKIGVPMRRDSSGDHANGTGG